MVSDNFGQNQTAESIIRRYADMIYRIAFHNVKTRADAEDIFQEVCIVLITKNPPVDDEAHLKHWLIRVTINKCNDFHKAILKHRTEPLDEQTELISPESRDVLLEVNRLPRQYRNVIYLYYYESYTISEIAQLLNKSPNTISSQLQRARKRLGKILTEGGDNDE